MNVVTWPSKRKMRAVHDRDLVKQRGVVHQVARGEVVAAVDDRVPALTEDAIDVLAGQPLLELHDLHVGVQIGDRVLGAVDLGHADARRRVHDLALQVGGVDHVGVHQAERADAGGSEIERGRRAEPAGAEQQHPRLEQLLLTLLADLGQEDVPRVAIELRRCELGGLLDGVAEVLPAHEARVRREHVLVAELGQSLRRERAANARRRSRR